MQNSASIFDLSLISKDSITYMKSKRRIGKIKVNVHLYSALS